jgi:hypothetical protein
MSAGGDFSPAGSHPRDSDCVGYEGFVFWYGFQYPGVYDEKTHDNNKITEYLYTSSWVHLKEMLANGQTCNEFGKSRKSES